MLEAASVTVRRGRAILLDRVSLAVGPGRLTVVLGPNGAGKSTLLAVLSGATRPDAGSVTFAGRAVEAWSAQALARRRAVLRQTIEVGFAMTAREVVGLGRSPHRGRSSVAEDARIVEHVMRRLGVGELAERSYPSLSGGERQRVQFARVLAQIGGMAVDGEVSCLLLDEPTTSLDPAHQERLFAIAREVAKAGHVVVAVLHDLNLAALVADRIVLLHRGRIVADGRPRAVLTPPVLLDVYGIEVDVLDHPRDGRPLVASTARAFSDA